MFEQILQWLDQFFLPNWQWLLPVFVFLEGLVVLSLAAPGLVAITLAGYYAGTGELPVFWVVGLVFIATVFGDLTSYWIGRTVSKCFSTGSLLVKNIENAVNRFARRTLWFVLLYNFTAYGRSFGPAAYGMFKAPFVPWFLLDMIGAAVWSTIMVSLAYGLGRSAKAIETGLNVPRVVEWILLLIFLAWVASLFFSIWRIVRQYTRQ